MVEWDFETGHAGGFNYINEVLAPGAEFHYLPHGRSDQWLSGIGIIDGRLHIQVTTDRSNPPSQGSPAVNARRGGELVPSVDMFFYSTAEGEIYRLWRDYEARDMYEWWNAHYEYREYVFEIDLSAPENYSFYFTTTVMDRVAGSWNITATLDSESHVRIYRHEFTLPSRLDGGTCHYFDTITVSPIGLRVSGRTTDPSRSGFYSFSLALETTGGEIDLGNSGAWVRYGGDELESGHFVELLGRADVLIDVASVTAVIINGYRIELY
jgi:hypothetical protein